MVAGQSAFQRADDRHRAHAIQQAACDETLGHFAATAFQLGCQPIAERFEFLVDIQPFTDNRAKNHSDDDQ